MTSFSTSFERAKCVLSWIQWLVSSLFIALALLGCGSSPPGQPPPTKKLVPKFAYVANYGSANVSAFAVDASNGNLSPLAESPFASGGGPISIVLDPKSEFLYVADHNSLLSIYKINGDGGLAEVVGSPFSIDLNAGGLAIHPSGKFLYVTTTDGASGKIWLYAINPNTGGIQVDTAVSFSAGTIPVGLAMDQKGHFLYVSDIASDQVFGFSIEQNSGALTPASGSPFVTGSLPSSITAASKTGFVYVPCQGNDAVFAYKEDLSTGALVQVSGSPFAVGHVPLFATTDIAQKFLYVTNAFSSTVSALSIDPTSGSLAEIPGSPFPTGTTPIAIAADPSNHFLFVTNGESTVSGYTIGNNGALAAIAGLPFGPTGSEPHAIVILGKLE